MDTDIIDINMDRYTYTHIQTYIHTYIYMHTCIHN